MSLMIPDHADEMRRAFDEFDKANPRVWSLFVSFANEAVAAGVKTLSASLIVERIRWEVMMQTQADDGFKINNNYRAFYARKYMEAYPHRAGMFKTRKAAADEAG